MANGFTQAGRTTRHFLRWRLPLLGLSFVVVCMVGEHGASLTEEESHGFVLVVVCL